MDPNMCRPCGTIIRDWSKIKVARVHAAVVLPPQRVMPLDAGIRPQGISAKHAQVPVQAPLPFPAADSVCVQSDFIQFVGFAAAVFT